jgi:hypothetical protein
MSGSEVNGVLDFPDGNQSFDGARTIEITIGRRGDRLIVQQDWRLNRLILRRVTADGDPVCDNGIQMIEIDQRTGVPIFESRMSPGRNRESVTRDAGGRMTGDSRGYVRRFLDALLTPKF